MGRTRWKSLDDYWTINTGRAGRRSTYALVIVPFRELCLFGIAKYYTLILTVTLTNNQQKRTTTTTTTFAKISDAMD